jgi:hypothetical protein
MEHLETVFHHDAIEKQQVRVVVVSAVVAGHAACREVSRTVRSLRRERRKAGREQ